MFTFRTFFLHYEEDEDDEVEEEEQSTIVVQLVNVKSIVWNIPLCRIGHFSNYSKITLS